MIHQHKFSLFFPDESIGSKCDIPMKLACFVLPSSKVIHLILRAHSTIEELKSRLPCATNIYLAVDLNNNWLTEDAVQNFTRAVLQESMTDELELSNGETVTQAFNKLVPFRRDVVHAIVSTTAPSRALVSPQHYRSLLRILALHAV